MLTIDIFVVSDSFGPWAGVHPAGMIDYNWYSGEYSLCAGALGHSAASLANLCSRGQPSHDITPKWGKYGKNCCNPFPPAVTAGALPGTIVTSNRVSQRTRESLPVREGADGLAAAQPGSDPPTQ